MMPSLTCSILPPPIHYAIEFKRNLAKDCSSLAAFISELGSKIAIVSNIPLGHLYGDSLCKSLNDLGVESRLFTFEDGEKYKSRSAKKSLEDRMLAEKFGRDTCLIALGGGVVLDMGGFIASTYCRGVPLIMVPTSLLGMVDACIGGKNGINLTYGKNLLGSIYQPKKVIIDSGMLKTLPKRELKNGMAEMIKHALICDAEYFDYLNEHSAALLDLDLDKIEKAIYISCQIKKRIVELDEKETGIRRLLNYGHTVGHALEKITRYRVPHGEAVAVGLATESYLGCLEGYLDRQQFELILQMIEKFNFSFLLTKKYSVENLIEAMNLDKKSRSNEARFVMIDKIGSGMNFEGEYCSRVNPNHLKQALEWMYHDLCRYSGSELSRC